MRLGYRDMTFCSYHKDCLQGKDCPRSLTDEVMEQAEMHRMGVVCYRDPPHCLEPKKYSVYEEKEDVVES